MSYNIDKVLEEYYDEEYGNWLIRCPACKDAHFNIVYMRLKSRRALAAVCQECEALILLKDLSDGAE